MKTNILLFLSFFLIISSCNLFKSPPPTIEITNEVPDSAWAHDTLKYNLIITASTLPVNLMITPSSWGENSDFLVDTIFELKNFNFDYKYVIPYGSPHDLKIVFQVIQGDYQRDSIIKHIQTYFWGS